MSIRSWFLRFFGTRRHKASPFVFSTLEFERLDIDRTSHQLRLREKAVENGSRNLPPTDATQLDGPQQQVIQFIKGETAEIRAGYERKLKGLEGQIEAVEIRHHTGAIQDLSRGLQQSLEDLGREYRPKIVQAGQDYQDASEDLRKFRLLNGLEHEPQYPESRFLHFSVLVAVLVLEAIVNSFFFQRGLPQGFAGGVSLALLLAFVDVLFVFILGRGMAWFVAPDWTHRLTAIGAGLFFAIWAVFYNLLIAHVRETIDPSSPLAENSGLALARFKENPFGLEEGLSWVLFALVFVFSVAAMLSALNWDEKFPGYGRRHRRRREMQEEYEYHLNELMGHALAARDQKLERLDWLLREAQEDLVVLKRLVETKDALLKTVRECIHHYADSCRALIHLYRDENTVARRNSPAPAYFQSPVDVELPPPIPGNTERDHAKVGLQESEFERVMKVAAAIREDLHGLHTRFVETLLGAERGPTQT